MNTTFAQSSKHFFYALCVISSEGPSSVVQNINSAREMLFAVSQSHPSDQAEEAIQKYGIFDPNMSRQLPTRHPPKTLLLLDRATCIDHMFAIIDTLGDAVALKDADDWANWSVSVLILFYANKLSGSRPSSSSSHASLCYHIVALSCRYAALRQHIASADLDQTSFFDDNSEAKLVVGRRSLTWLVYSFIHQYNGLSTEELDDMKRSKTPYFPGDSERSQLGYNFGFWIAKLAGVRSYLFSLTITE